LIGPATSPVAARSLGPTLTRAGARILWLGLVPLAIALLAIRYLVPGRWVVGTGFWGWLANFGAEHTLLLGVVLFLALSLVVRQFRDVIPWGRYLGPETASQPPAVSRYGAVGRAASFAGMLVVAATAALALRAAIGQPYQVASVSMLPTLEPSDDLLVSKLVYGIRWPGRAPASARLPHRGDVVVFQGRAVGEQQDLLVKRVIGLPGDRITTTGGLVKINGWQVPFCDVGKYIYFSEERTLTGRVVMEFLEDRAYLTLHLPEALPFVGNPVAAGQVFVIGDNRSASRDSRLWSVRGRAGGVPTWAIEGKAWRVIGWDRNGHLDLGRFLTRPGLGIHLPGMDVRPMEGKIAACLKNRPKGTWPPPP
jgi:signal peptidase I